VVDILLRGLPDEIVFLYEEEAKSRRSSRNEVMVQQLREHAPLPSGRKPTSAAQWDRFFEAAVDLGNQHVMAGAWD